MVNQMFAMVAHVFFLVGCALLGMTFSCVVDNRDFIMSGFEFLLFLPYYVYWVGTSVGFFIAILLWVKLKTFVGGGSKNASQHEQNIVLTRAMYRVTYLISGMFWGIYLFIMAIPILSDSSFFTDPSIQLPIIFSVAALWMFAVGNLLARSSGKYPSLFNKNEKISAAA